MLNDIAGYALVFIGAVFNAFMDRVENKPAYDRSIFKNWNQRFWLKEISWQYAYKLLGYKFDGWHIAKSIMLICLSGAMCCEFKGSWWVVLINIGIIWNLTFSLFYDKIFKIK